MSNASKIPGARRLRYGALPYRVSSRERAEFMLVTSRETRRWIIPKGWPKRGKSPHRSAAREAFEEAGIVGAVGRQTVGSFSYEKRLKNGRSVECEVRVFPLQVKRQSKAWPEKFEEAGVVGAVDKRSVGSCSYEKRLKSGAVVVCKANDGRKNRSGSSGGFPPRKRRKRSTSLCCGGS